MSLADQLFAIEQIKPVQNKYSSGADQKKWDDLASVFAPIRRPRLFGQVPITPMLSVFTAFLAFR
ncbi:hypothetical protein AB4Y87_25595 [Paenarthrobacter sp. RAF54_2]|uniref:hypothetical protein n=1 Tax=Paenarthrobacter sp. RAF54_2 TaxID=3233061 RepID=UPI003F9E3925